MNTEYFSDLELYGLICHLPLRAESCHFKFGESIKNGKISIWEISILLCIDGLENAGK